MGKRTIIKTLYGSVAMLRAYCPSCESYSFIQEGKFVCCNLPFGDIPEKEVTKRVSAGENKRSHISLKIKKRVLEGQDNRCIYCDVELGSVVWDGKYGRMRQVKTHFDHFIAWVNTRDNHEENIFASCSLCNAIKHDKYFKDVVSAREFILSRRGNRIEQIEEEKKL